MDAYCFIIDVIQMFTSTGFYFLIRTKTDECGQNLRHNKRSKTDRTSANIEFEQQYENGQSY